jgi:hypothetical protein
VTRALAWSSGLALLGAVSAAILALVSGWPARDAVLTVAIAGGSALVASVGGASVQRRLRGRSTRVQALAIALSSLAVLLVGILIAALAMFISGHDLEALLVVVIASAGVAIGAALQMGEEMGEGRRTIGDLAERLAAGEALGPTIVTGPGEMRQLADQLADVSRRLDQSRPGNGRSRPLGES